MILTMTNLKDAIRGVYDEHIKCEDVDGFCHDMAILISEALHDGFNQDEMIERLVEYKRELQEIK